MVKVEIEQKDLDDLKRYGPRRYKNQPTAKYLVREALSDYIELLKEESITVGSERMRGD